MVVTRFFSVFSPFVISFSRSRFCTLLQSFPAKESLAVLFGFLSEPVFYTVIEKYEDDDSYRIVLGRRNVPFDTCDVRWILTLSRNLRSRTKLFNALEKSAVPTLKKETLRIKGRGYCDVAAGFQSFQNRCPDLVFFSFTPFLMGSLQTLA